jgi:hypothetical protein
LLSPAEKGESQADQSDSGAEVDPHPEGKMTRGRQGMPGGKRGELLGLLFFFLLLIRGTLLPAHFFIFLIVIVFVIGNDVEVNGVDLDHLEFDFALRAAQDLAFFYFVFVDVNFSSALRTANHGEDLLRMGSNPHGTGGIIYRCLCPSCTDSGKKTSTRLPG